jgi:hypothetical protein
MDWRAVSKEVLALAESEDAFGAMVKEAVEVVRDGLQAHGCVHFVPIGHPTALTLTQGQITYQSPSMAVKIVYSTSVLGCSSS